MPQKAKTRMLENQDGNIDPEILFTFFSAEMTESKDIYIYIFLCSLVLSRVILSSVSDIKHEFELVMIQTCKSKNLHEIIFRFISFEISDRLHLQRPKKKH